MAQVTNNSSNIYDFNKEADRKLAMSLGHLGYGNDAIAMAKREFGRELSPMESLLIKHEGFTTRPYLDTKGIKTIGVGQVGTYYDPLDIKGGFEKAFSDKVASTKSTFGDAYDLSDDFKKGALLSLVYRGDTKSKTSGNTYKWVAKFKKAQKSRDPVELEDAFNEFWDNKEYKELISKNPSSGVLARIRENSQILFGKTK
jgi:GH24 family phage-related lysozyme (muramidase)